jgi:hypothetical protein
MRAKLMNCSVDYKAQEVAFQETLGQAAKQGATQPLQECVEKSQISKRTKATDRQLVRATKQADQWTTM